MSESYVVRGADVTCNMGSKTTQLNLPESHGIYVNEKPVLVDTDTAVGVNIMPFGKCRNRRSGCKPALAPCWKDVKDDALIKGRPGLITRSILSCTLGGKITIKTDGQN